MHYGAEKVGCLVIPAGPGNSERQLLLMQDFRTTVIHVTPSYALYLADFLEKKGVDPRRDLALRKAFVGAEPYTEETRRKIEQALGIDVYNSYGLSEMNGPGVAFECEHKCGMHLWEDNFLVEILDPRTGEPVPDGRNGRVGADHPVPRSDAVAAIPHPRHHVDRFPDPVPAAAPTVASTASPAAPTTC